MGEWKLLKNFPKTNDDGQPAKVLVCSMPAKFYKIIIDNSPNSVGDMQPGFSLATGSGMEKLAIDIAKAAADGMLGVADKEKDGAK